ncbi:GNAT family N-acetyltransferase [Ferrovibrio sp.]|uniref:GNAT family N-acetyltransferase n=1 Tax=Ferrovibrio sp. TaxID=1917215 RepID=UPI0025BE2747|nr:GNAT family N-acetyltransferase [Ferrovibrio sp.]
MSMTYRIRPARPSEADAIRAIERAAGQSFATVGYPDVAQHDPTPAADLRDAATDGALFVAVGSDDTPVGFLLCTEIDGDLYVQELAVHPDHAGHRLAVPLLKAAEDFARSLGLPALCLTTFRTVPWNAPYYERLGFHVLSDNQIGPSLRLVIARQKAAGLDVANRVAMRRYLPA